ncbi:uncharacterized protein [Montipora capricornis]|uniref:uncharacterized protein n=1 Tax=Montipora capricornis TaxID=246305 RepID=UPI0035F1EAA3
MRWNKEVNKVVMECFYRSKPFDEEGKPIRGYRQRLFREWRDREMFEATEQRVCDQTRVIRRNGWLSELELEAIKRQVEDECQDDLWEGQEVTVETETVEIDAGTGEEEINGAEDGIGDTEGDMNEKYRMIVDQLEEITREGRTCDGIMFKKVDKKVLRVQTDRVNEGIKYLQSKSITETNNLIRATSVWVAEQLGLKKAEHRKKNEPRWKRRIEGDIKRLKQEVNFLERESKGELGLKKKRKLSELNERYRVKSKGLKTKKIYAEFNGDGIRSNDVPNAEESKRFWADIWSAEKGHNREAEWPTDLKIVLENEEHLQDSVVISVEKARKQCRKMPNWKAPGKDGVQGYWIKKP